MEAPLFSSPALFFFSVSPHFAPLFLFSAFLSLLSALAPPPPPPPHTPPTPLSLLSVSPPASGSPLTHADTPLLRPPSPPRSPF